MDRILAAEPSLIDNELDNKSEPPIDSNNEYLSSLSVKSFKEKKDENKDQFFIARDAVHRIRSDDIIGTELPANILDTDSYDKNEDGSIMDSKSHTFDISRTDISEKSFCKVNESTECNKNNMIKLISENTKNFSSETAVDGHCSNSAVIITSNLCTNRDSRMDTAKPYVSFINEDQLVNPINKVETETVSVINEDSIDSTVKEIVGVIQSEKNGTEKPVRILNKKNDLAQLDETTNFAKTNKMKSNDKMSSEKGLATASELEKSMEESIIESNEVGISVGSTFVESSFTEHRNVSQTNEEILNCIANLDDKKNETGNEGTDGFIPTIIDIRGACTGNVSGSSTGKSASSVSLAVDVNVELATSRKNELPKFSNIKSDFKYDSIDEEQASVHKESESVAVHTIDDENGMFSKEDCDLMSVEIHHSDSCFTSEIDIKEEKMSHTEDRKPEVFCIGSPSKIPLPIPVKLESSIDSIEKSTSKFESGVKMIRREILSTARNGKVIMVTADPDYDVLVSADRSRNMKDCLYSISGYTCHLCNKTFQEHELLNDHMILHRNNSLVNSRLKKPPKKKTKPFECAICNKCLSSLPSLHQHMMIHKNEKPYICTYCKKDFRHQSQFRSHVQKYHEAEEKKRKQEEEKKESAGKNSVRGVDFGKLVGPLFVKESLLHQKSKQSEIKTSTKSENVWYNKEAVTYQTSKETGKKGSKHAYAVKRTNKMTFEQPFFRKKDNTKENLTSSAKRMVGRSRTGPITRARTAAEVTTDDDIVPLKTFNNVENIVMNATRYIVKLDNLDPNLLKRRIKTPDISIDKSSVSGKRTAEKRRVVLISSDPAKRLKLDQIENIIIDDGSAPSASSAEIPLGQSGANEPDSETDYPDPDNLSVFSNTEDEPPMTNETLTHNELLEVLDDDTPISNQEPEKRKLNVVVPQLNGNELAAFKKETEKKNDSGPSQNNREVIREVLENSSRTQSVVMVKLSLPSKRSQLEEEEEEMKSSTADLVVKKPIEEKSSYRPKSDVNETSSEVHSNTNAIEFETIDESDEDEDSTLDAFDAAFQKVAQRRLLMIRNRAALNDGKVENKYLLGPLFWRKAIRRARLNAFEVYQATLATDLEPDSDQSNIKKRSDERRTNDPAKLQVRAEAKLGSILNKLKCMKNLSSLNLAGPLFWRKTLQLAGIRRPEDLFTLLNSEKLSLHDIQFVDTDIFPTRHKNDKSDDLSIAPDLHANSRNTDILALSNMQQDSNERTLQTQSEDKGKIKTFVDLIGDGEQKLVSSILHNVASVRSASDSKSRTVLEPMSSSNSNSSKSTQQISSKVIVPSTSCNTADSILYDSLTRSVRAHSSNVLISASPLLQTKSVAAKSSTVADTMLIDNANEMNTLEQSTFNIPVVGRELTLSGNNKTGDPKKCDSKLSTRLTERYKMDVSRSGTSSNPDSRSGSLAAQTHSAVDGGNIVLNMNGDLQLIAPPDPTKTTNVQDGANYVLVSDETGAMRLVKEHDLRLVESSAESDSSAPQYVVNIQGENYSNLELIADGSGEHLTYALQFDGENYSAVQFVQNDAEILDGKQLKTDEELNEDGMCKSRTKFTAPETVTDLNHIGKELSDFLNLDYGTLLKNDSTNQAQ